MEIIKNCIALKKELDSLRPLNADDEQRIMQKFRLDWNYHSNHLEGNSLTFGETKALILHGITANGKSLKDHFEVQGHNEALLWVLDIVKEDRPLTENFIRELHKLILKEDYKIDAITPDGKPTKKTVKVGQYKSTPNHVKTATGEIFRFATPEDTPAKMQELLTWYKESSSKDDINPILLAAEFHYKYIRIHPFDDGNGRTARILMNFILLQHNYPPVIIKTEEKENYFAALRLADAGDINPFINYIATNLNHSLEIMIQGAKGESIEEADDIDKEIALLKQRVKSKGPIISIRKSVDSILSIYDKSITQLMNSFCSKSKNYDELYFKSLKSMIIDNSTEHSTEGIDVSNLLNKSRFKISQLNISKIDLKYEHYTFKYNKVEDLFYKSIISIQFNNIHYYVSNHDGSIRYQKFYHDQLNEEEITQIVNSEIKAHKEFIEAKLKEVEDKK